MGDDSSQMDVDGSIDLDASVVGDASSFVDPYGGASGCGEGVQPDPQPCRLMMPVSGALSGVLSGSSHQCGWSTVDFKVGVNLPPPASGALNVQFTSATIVPGRTGTAAAVRVELAAFFNTADGSASGAIWMTPFTCTLDITSNACAPNAMLPSLYVVSGTGHCPDPAEPYRTDAGSPITIGEFWFAAEYVAATAGDP